MAIPSVKSEPNTPYTHHECGTVARNIGDSPAQRTKANSFIVSSELRRVMSNLTGTVVALPLEPRDEKASVNAPESGELTTVPAKLATPSPSLTIPARGNSTASPVGVAVKVTGVLGTGFPYLSRSCTRGAVASVI